MPVAISRSIVSASQADCASARGVSVYTHKQKNCTGAVDTGRVPVRMCREATSSDAAHNAVLYAIEAHVNYVAGRVWGGWCVGGAVCSHVCGLGSECSKWICNSVGAELQQIFDF